MAEPDTRERLKRAAQRLFAERGIDGVPVRDIVRAAGQRNVGSLHYYFGSKEALVRELVVDGAKIIDVRRNAQLDALESVGGPHGLREILDILIWPSLDLGENGEGESYIRFITSMQLNHHDLFLSALEGRWNSGYQRCLAHIRELLPHLPREVLNQRLVFMSLLTRAALSAREAALDPTQPGSRFWTQEETLHNLIDSIRGLLEQPPSTP